MIQWIFVCMICVGLMGCTSPSTGKSYTYYELVHSPGQLKVGERVKIMTKDNVEIEGSIIRMSGDGLVVSDEGEGNLRLWWKDIHVMHKVVKATAED